MARDSRQVLTLEQCHLTASRGAAVTVANDALRDVEVSALKREHWLAAPRANGEPSNLSRSHRRVQKLRQHR